VNSCGTAKNCYTDTSSTISYTINNSVLQQGTNGQQNNLIDGIESMQIVYGVDTNEDRTANYYVPANNLTINDWSKVASVRISLLAATLDNNLTTQSLPYVFNDKTITPPGTDHKIRRVFTTTIALRNRLP
jgi:type IV pilus assembly protein PilW